MKRLFMFISIACIILLSFEKLAYSYGWGFKRAENENLPDVGKYEEILAPYTAYYVQATKEKKIYLTFDNGYEEGYTESILDILQKHKVPATFFVTGHYVESEPALVNRMIEEGHIIGNHSNHHPDFTKMNKAEINKELKDLEHKLATRTKQKETLYVRPPRGTFNEKTLQWIEELGYVQMFWSVAFKDWEVNKQKGWQYAYKELMKQIHPGAIILLHTVSKDNALALEKAIVSLKKRGYHFKSLDDFMFDELLDERLF